MMPTPKKTEIPKQFSEIIQLAAVKEGLYHPKLPTFRRMDMDTAAHKLPDEHCRTTSLCGPDDFRNATVTYFKPATNRYAGSNITDTGRKLRETLRNDIGSLKIDWSEANEITKFPTFQQKGDLRFSGYAVRYMKPSITSSWRYSLRQEPKLDQYGQRPVPANIFSRYRDTFPQYSRNISTESYR